MQQTNTVTGVQFTRGGAHMGIWSETCDGGGPDLAIDLGKDMMSVLGITDHKVAGKLLEMRHWHTHKYLGHRPVGVYWIVKDGKKGLLQSLINAGKVYMTYEAGAEWIDWQHHVKHWV